MISKEQIASRWRKEWVSRPELVRLSREFLKVLSFLDEVPAARAALAKEGKLSEGLNDAVREHYADAVVPNLRRAVHEVELTINDIAGRRARLCQIEVDKTDIASALLRQEMRQRLVAMSEGERVGTIMLDTQIRGAAFEGPAMLSGFTEQSRAELKRRLMVDEYPEEAALLEKAEEAVKVANTVIGMVAGALQQSAGFDNEQALGAL